MFYENTNDDKMKKLNMLSEFNSIFHDLKWLCSIEVTGFSSRRTKDNKIFYNKIVKAVDEYNK